MRTDEELMVAVSDGEFEAFEELVRRYQKLAVSIAYNLLDDSSAAEEVAQEAFLKILRNAEDYSPSAAFKTYLGRVVSRLCYDRTDKNRPANLDPVDQGEFRPEGATHEDPLDRLIDDERKQKIRNGLDELTDRQRTAIVLQTFEDFTYEEIAGAMDTTKKSVERLLARARETLQEYLADKVEV
jgi:RNA polymerase sigma-70 factor (ECF subfamily)